VTDLYSWIVDPSVFTSHPLPLGFDDG